MARRSCDEALAASELAVRAVIFFEAGRLLKRGRVTGPPTVREWRHRLLSLGVREVAVTSEVAVVASELDDLHGDPIDRIIVATAIVEGAQLLTADRQILDWPGSMRRQDVRR